MISARREGDFFKWFMTNSNRETIQNLTREFREELIDTGLVPSEPFIGKKLTYAYIGSYIKKSVNSMLNIRQTQYYDVVSVQLSDAQQNAIRQLTRESPSQGKPSYIFATRDEIMQGYCDRPAMGRRKISQSAKYILVSGGPSLDKSDHLKGNYTLIMKERDSSV